MIVVGPEDPLVNGIYDFFKNDSATNHIMVIGPSAKGAQLEGSKEFAKEFMQRHHIPTARYLTITAETIQQGFDFLETLQPPYVLKADGLCAGKGVLIVPTLDEAKKELKRGMETMRSSSELRFNPIRKCRYSDAGRAIKECRQLARSNYRSRTY